MKFRREVPCFVLLRGVELCNVDRSQDYKALGSEMVFSEQPLSLRQGLIEILNQRFGRASGSSREESTDSVGYSLMV